MNCCTRRDCAHWWDECGTGYHYCNFFYSNNKIGIQKEV